MRIPDLQPVLTSDLMHDQIEMQATPAMLEAVNIGNAGDGDEVDDEKLATRSKTLSRKKLIVIAAITAIIVTVAVVVPVVFVTSGDGSGGSSSSATGTTDEYVDAPIATIPNPAPSNIPTAQPITSGPTVSPTFHPSTVPSAAPSTQAPTCGDPQLCALRNIFESTNGDAWSQQENWLTTENICEWYGVSCASDGVSIEVLDLSGNGLAGSLPDAEAVWEGLGSLLILNLRENSITGTIPSSISVLSDLISLNLNNNNFTGTLPIDFENLTKLQILSIQYNDMSGLIPDDGPICQLKSNGDLFVFNADCSPTGMICDCCWCFA